MAWVLDLDGVIWLSDQPVPGAAEAVARLRAAGERVLFLTNNSSAPVGDQEAKLAGFFVGQVMAATRGKADGKAVTALLRERLGSRT